MYSPQTECLLPLIAGEDINSRQAKQSCDIDIKQQAQLSQRDRATAAWVSFDRILLEDCGHIGLYGHKLLTLLSFCHNTRV